MFVGISDAAIVFLFEFVFRAARIGVAPLPKCLDKLLALFVRRVLLERRALFGRDDVGDLLVNPLLIRRLQFLLRGFLPALFFPAELFLFLFGFFLFFSVMFNYLFFYIKTNFLMGVNSF